jgi:oligosaccharide 4-alpha-D-glucosyltransferase
MRFSRPCILAVLFLCVFAPAQAEFGNYESHAQAGQTLRVTTDVGELAITVIDEAAFEVHYAETGRKQLPSFALAGPAPQLGATLAAHEDRLEFSADELTAVIHKSPLRIEYRRNGEPLVAEERGYVADDEAVGFRFALDAGEKIMGGGQRVLGMDRRGHRMPLYNRAHYGYETESRQMYYRLPAVMSSGFGHASRSQPRLPMWPWMSGPNQ